MPLVSFSSSIIRDITTIVVALGSRLQPVDNEIHQMCGENKTRCNISQSVCAVLNHARSTFIPCIFVKFKSCTPNWSLSLGRGCRAQQHSPRRAELWCRVRRKV
ncbi:hypothetical protein BsWGS_19079 [Bradybaena similaris]